MIYKNKTLYGSEIIFNHNIELIDDLSLSEADIDSKSIELLKGLGWKEHDEIRQRKTNISEIDNYIKSKAKKSKRKGSADIYILSENKLKIIIDNKNPKESIEKGIADAIFYAQSLLENGYDIRIAMSYNGNKCLLRVYEPQNEDWVPLLINGKELKAFPSKELVNLIYTYKGLKSISIIEDTESINIKNIVKDLKDIYRNVPHLQNDNQKTIDFTISFIALKLILEKHGATLGKNWEDFKVSEQKKLKENIKTAVEDIIDNLENGYGEIFKIKEDVKGQINAFDFLDVIKQFDNNVKSGEKGDLIKIFEKVNELPHLHSSKFDLFGEVYQSLMDKDTRKRFGQFFTPRHLIKTMIRLFYEDEIEKLLGDVEHNQSISPKKICDPACGTGGFLTESFKYFEDNIVDFDIKDLAKKSIYGFDLYPANAVRSRINMYLAGDGFSEIESLNSLNELDENKIQFDYILTNPPFGKGDLTIDTDIISSKKKEVNFLIKIVKLLKVNGKALIIVPDGILETPTLAPLRKWLIQNCKIEKIIGLPKHIFAPYTHEKTYVLFLEKRSKFIDNLDEVKTERIWMYITDNDGYANSDKRFRTGKQDKDGKYLHDELSIWRDPKGKFHISTLEENWKKKIQPLTEKYFDIQGNEIEGLKYGFVGIDQVNEENNYKLLCEFHLRLEKPKKTSEKEFKNVIVNTANDLQDIDNQVKTLENYGGLLKNSNKIKIKDKISNLLNIDGGNSGLTEEFIYNNPPLNPRDSIPVLSGATLKNNLMGHVSKKSKPGDKNLKIYKAPAILVVRKGLAGHMTYIPSGEVTINDDAYIMTLKEGSKNKINLRWFVYEFQGLFYKLVASKKANGTFNKTFTGEQKINVPNKKLQDEIAKNLLMIDSLINNLTSSKEKLERLRSHEIIY